jgi:hypothetical protein
VCVSLPNVVFLNIGEMNGGGEVGGFGLKAAHERVLHVRRIYIKIQVEREEK